MLKFYYTGATSFRAEQNLATTSLGGYVSISTVQNGITNNLFPNIAERDIWENQKANLIGLFAEPFFFTEDEKEKFVKNNSLKIKIKFNWDSGTFDSYSEKEIKNIKDSIKFFIGIGPISKNESDELFTEKVQSQSAIPYYFLTNGFLKLEDNILIEFQNENLQNGFCVWLRRVFTPEAGLQDLFDCYSEYWVKLAEQDPIKQDSIPNLNFPFTLKVNLEIPD